MALPPDVEAQVRRRAVNEGLDRLYSSPSFRKQIEAYAGQANPYSINSNNFAEQERAKEWLRTQEQFMKEGRPAALDWRKMPTAFDPKTGKMRTGYGMSAQTIDLPGQGAISSVMPGLRNDLSGINLNTEALQALRGRGLSMGASPWLNLQLEKQAQDEMNLKNEAISQAAGNAANARSALAMRGGIGSGARERLARSAMMNTNANLQNISSGGASNRLNLQIADDAQKTDILKALPGMELSSLEPAFRKTQMLTEAGMTEQGRALDSQKFNAGQAAEANKFNSSAALNELLQQRAFESNKYNEAMKAWGAEKTAQATGGGGKK